MISHKQILLHDDRNGYLAYRDSLGTFFIYEGKGICKHFAGCREEFAHDFKNNVWLGFSSDDKLNIEKLNEFFTSIESNLKLEKQTVFFKVKGRFSKIAVVIKISPFWKKNELNRAIFTLLLRCGAVYYNNHNNTLDKALKAYSLTRIQSSFMAIKRFLAGYTKPTFKLVKYDYHYRERTKIQFVNHFYRMNRYKINKQLIKN